MRRTYTERLKKKEFKMTIVNRIKDLSPKERSIILGKEYPTEDLKSYLEEIRLSVITGGLTKK